MEITHAPPPIQSPATDAPAKAGDVTAPTGAAEAELALLLEMQSAANDAMARREEVGRLTAELLALLQDPSADPEAIADLRTRLDLAVLRAELADQTLHSHAELATTLAASETELESHRDFFNRIAVAIAEIEDTYVKRAQAAGTNYTEWYQQYSDIASKMKDALSPSTEKGKESFLLVDLVNVRKELTDFIAEYEDQSLGTFPTQEEAVRFLKDAGLGVDDFPITQSAPGKWEIGYPLDAVRKVRDSMAPHRETWSTPVYQEWLSRKKGFEESFQGDNRLLLENFSNVNSTFQNLNNVLSESIKSMTEVDRLFLQST